MPAASPPPKGWAHLRPCARRAGTASFRCSLQLGRRDTGPSIRAGLHTGPFIPVHERAPPESTPGRKILGPAGAGHYGQREPGTMNGQIPTGEIHHLRLTVSDVDRSRRFYTGLLGFAVAVESPPADDPSASVMSEILFGGIVMIRGNLLMGLRPVAPANDRFDEDR